MRVALVSLPLLFSYGLPLVLVDVEAWVSQRIIQLLIVAIFPLHVLKYVRLRLYPKHYTMMFGFLVYMTGVSAVYNIAISPNPLMSWLPGVGVFLPLLLFSFYDYFGVTIKEAAAGFIVVAIFCAVLAAIDQISNISSLDSFVRTATFDTGLRRLVLAKTEQGFATALIVAIFLRTSSNFFRLLLVFCGLLIFYAIVVVSESRLVLAATFIGCAIYTAFLLKSRYRILVLVAMGILVLMAAPLFLAKYSSIVENIDLANTDPSVIFRNRERAFFEAHFNSTYGLGFGYMYFSRSLNNILSFAMFRAGTLFGAVDYPVSLGDIGLYGALYQFGYVGFVIVLSFTGIMLLDMLRAGKDVRNPNQHLFGAFGAVALAFMLSPLPMNFFTLDWTVTFGGTLWYIAHLATQRLEPALPATPRCEVLRTSICKS